MDQVKFGEGNLYFKKKSRILYFKWLWGVHTSFKSFTGHCHILQEKINPKNDFLADFLTISPVSGQCSHFIPPTNTKKQRFLGVFKGYKMVTLARKKFREAVSQNTPCLVHSGILYTIFFTDYHPSKVPSFQINQGMVHNYDIPSWSYWLRLRATLVTIFCENLKAVN